MAMEVPSLLCKITTDWGFSWNDGWLFYICYHRGLLVFLFLSVIGIWLIPRVFKKDTKFLNGLLKIPPWLLAVCGVLLQVPAVIYIYLGIRAGFFSF
jgi:hypothetical protein